MSISHDEHLPQPGDHEFGAQQGNDNLGGNPHDFTGEQVGVGAAPFDTVSAMREGLMRDGLHPSQNGLGQGSFNRRGPTAMGGFAIPASAGWPQSGTSGWGAPPPFNVVDMEDHMRFVATIEEEFANYLSDFPPVYMENDEREENVKKAICMGVAMARNLREFVVAQMTEHLASRQHGHDPFFAHNRMPLLIPVSETAAEAKALETIPFAQYYRRLTNCFPNFTTPSFMHLIVAFGPALKVGVPTVEGMARQHYVILPDAKTLVDVLIKQVTHLAQNQRRV